MGECECDGEGWGRGRGAHRIGAGVKVSRCLWWLGGCGEVKSDVGKRGGCDDDCGTCHSGSAGQNERLQREKSSSHNTRVVLNEKIKRILGVFNTTSKKKAKRK